MKGYITNEVKEENRLYLGYKKTGWESEGYYIDISRKPTIMVMGSEDDINQRISTLIGYSVIKRLFDSETVLEIYGEKPNIKEKYIDFNNVYGDKSIRTLLIDLEKDVSQRIEELEKENVKNIKEYNKQSQKTMKRRIVIIDGFEDVIDNSIVSKIIFNLLSHMRVVGITVVVTVNTEMLNEKAYDGKQMYIISKVLECFTCKVVTKNQGIKFNPLLKPKPSQLKENQMMVVNDTYDDIVKNNRISEVLQIAKLEK